MQELLQHEPNITRIKISRPVLRATRRPDGTWSLARLMPWPRFSDNAPHVTVEDGSIEVFDPLKNPSGMLTVRDLHLELSPLESPSGGRAAYRVAGHLTADKMQRLELSGKLDSSCANWEIDGSLQSIELCPELHASLPGNLAGQLEPLASIRGDGRLRFHATRDVQRTPQIRFDCRGQITRGRIDHARLPYPLTDLKARFQCDNNGVVIEDVTARNGRTTLHGSGRIFGYRSTSPLSLQVSARRVLIDSQFADVMPPSLRTCWYDYLPDGEVDADVKLDFDGRTWRPEVAMQCLNTSFAYRKLPYRLERATGSINLKDRRLDLRLTAYAGPERVRLEGTVFDPGPHFTGGVEVTADDIPFDEKLFTALPAKVSRVVRSLNPRGVFDVCLRYGRQRADERPNQYIGIALNRCSIRYQRFPYPIENIRGSIESRNGRWTFRDLTGTNDTGTMVCNGELGPVSGQEQLVLHASGQNVVLEEELRDALPPHVARAWDSFKPRGTVDVPTITIVHWPAMNRTSVALTATPRDDGVSIEPVCFPYRMERLRGALHYRDGQIDVVDLAGAHGRTTFSGAGSCSISPDGSWHLHLGRMNVDRIVADHELIAALPGALKRAVAEIKPTGMINMRGEIDFLKPVAGALRSSWDTAFNLQQSSLDCGLKLENVFGGVRLRGSCDGGRFTSHGELELDSLTYRNCQYTDVFGPMWIDNQRVLLGAWPETRDGPREPRQITAKLLGGTVYGRGRVQLGATAFYNLWASLAGADLAQLSQQGLAPGKKLNGKLQANLQLQGTTKGAETLDGIGSVHLREADIYELPLMVALLKIISVKPPDTTAFTASDVYLRVKGEHILFDRILFSGDAVSLAGQGEMSLDRQINLTLHATAGRGEWNIPLVRNLIGEASQQIMQIRVEGKLDNPTTRNEPFPGVSKALEELQANFQPVQRLPDAHPAPAAAPPPAMARRPLSYLFAR